MYFCQISLLCVPMGPIDDKPILIPKGPNDIKANSDSGNGLAPHRKQAIISTKADPVY